jgi:hypothetical protein
MGLGTPEAVSLTAARKLAADAKAAFAEGRDPIAERVEALRLHSLYNNLGRKLIRRT